VSEREKQTYYGAINYLTKQLILREYATANSENTVAFLKNLQSLNPEARHLIIWDGASYHKYTGDISPLAQGGSPPTKLNCGQLVTLVAIIE
jgi:transposase